VNIHLCVKQKEFVLSKQCLRSGTAIGALISEAAYGQSKADFVNKMSVALKEANETLYWLELLHETDYLDEKAFESLKADIKELLKILIASIKTAKRS
jgi:four helix bundle protein